MNTEVPRWLIDLDDELTSKNIFIANDDKEEIQNLAEKLGVRRKKIEDYLQVAESHGFIDRKNRSSFGDQYIDASNYNKSLDNILEKTATDNTPPIAYSADD